MTAAVPESGQSPGPGSGPVSPVHDLWRRALSSAVIIPPVLLVLWWGGSPFTVLILASAALMAWEWGSMVSGARTPSTIAGVVAAFSAVAVSQFVEPLTALVFLVCLSGAVLVIGSLARWSAPLWSASGVFVIALACISVLWLRHVGPSGLEVTLWVISTVVVTDVAAYGAGRSIGGAKLAPSISPNKTWAGGYGGLFAATALGFGAAILYGFQEPWWLALAGAAIAIVAQFGDLVESAVKRRFEVKDSGALIPGHGGLLDRLDGQLAALPVAALIVSQMDPVLLGLTAGS